MKRLTKSIKKVTAVFLSMILSFPLLWTAPAFPALAAEITLTSADLVSANYEGLSDKEKAVLTSGLMSGSSFSFGTPEGMDSDLVSVNTIDATITALPYASGTYQWNPVSAKVLYGDEEETVTLTNGVGAYAYEGNDFRVEVRYEVSIPVDAAEQEKLLNGPHYLAKGLENIAAVADQESGFFTVGDNVSMLKKLIDGSLPHNASLNTDATIAAIQHLIDDADSNAGYLTIDLLIMDGYFMANSPSEYLIQNGAVFKAAAVSVYNDMKQIAEDGGVDSLLELLRTQSTTDYRKLSRAISSLRSIVDGIEEATSDDWTVLKAGKNPLKAGMTTAEYQALDGLLQAAGTTSLHEDQILTSLTGPAVTLAENVNQFDVTIKYRRTGSRNRRSTLPI